VADECRRHVARRTRRALACGLIQSCRCTRFFRGSPGRIAGVACNWRRVPTRGAGFLSIRAFPVLALPGRW